MNQRSDKLGPGGANVAPKKVDQNGQFCNRIGCSGRIKDSQNTRIGSSDKSKCHNPSFRASIGNEISRKSSRSSSIMTSAKKPDDRELLSSQSSRTGYESSSVSSNVRPRKISHHYKSGFHNQNTPSVQSDSRSSAVVGSFNRCNGDGLRNLKCNSISDAVPVGKKMMKRRSLEGESSSSHRERKSTYAPMSVDTRTRLSGRQIGRNGLSVREHAVGISETSDSELPSSVGGGRSLSLQFSARGSRSYDSNSNGENPSDTVEFASDEAGFTHLMNDGVLHGYNMGGVAEMLLALERIEQEEEELTHEDLLALETSLFLGTFNLYDQHRDMRLDIDNMSYEELLALEERMGTVSTALPEDALSKCLRKSVYQATPSKVQMTGLCEDGCDIKCSICQEEYVSGDEIGKLVECEHGYHIRCINKWLQLKNWCPICKTSAQTSSTSS